MIRSLLLWASTNPWMQERLPRYPFVRRAVRRFMPGERAEDAFREAERLREASASTLLTLLGENVATEEEAAAVVDHYLGVLDEVRGRGLDTEVSVKLTQLGLDLGTELALEHVRRLAKAAAAPGSRGNGTGRADAPVLLWIDMESSVYLERTLDIYRVVRAEHQNVGIALQAYLYRTPSDLDVLLPLRPAIRLVKGAYLEPRELAHVRKRDVDAAYHSLARRLLMERRAGRLARPTFGTHDPRMIGDVTRMARELELAQEAYEFGMLYGIGTAQQRHLLQQGYRLRVLISYGDAWFPWYMRRLAERPANLWFVIKQVGRAR